MKKFFVFLSIIFLGLSACNQDPVEVSPDLIKATKSQSAFDKVMQNRGTSEGSDAFEILDATISDELLTITVQYSGGCENHEFEAIWSGDFYPTFTDPPLAPVVITHNSNGDLCEAAITEVLQIDVRGLFGSDYSTDKFIPILENGSSDQSFIAKTVGKCDFTGTVIIDPTFDGCSVYINLDNGTTIEPVEISDENFKFEHLQRVSLSYTTLDIATVCMVGQAARVDCIQQIGDGASVRGVVKDYTGLDGCGFIIELEDGTTLEPAEVMVRNFEFRDNQKVWLTYVSLTNQVSVCMVGELVRVTGITERE